MKRMVKKIGAFPFDDSPMRLADSITIGINEEYVAGSYGNYMPLAKIKLITRIILTITGSP